METIKTGDADMMVIGGCINSPRTIYDVAQVLQSSKYFQLDAAAIVYDILLDMMKQSAQIDILTVTDKCLQLEGRQRELASPMFLMACTDTVSSGAHSVEHAKIVKKNWKRSKLIDEYAAQHQVLINGGNPDDSILSMQTVVMNVTDERNESVQTMDEAIRDMDKRAQDVYERGGEMAGEPFTGVPEIDRIFSGIELGDVIMIAARPKVGKSSISNNILKHSADNDIPTYCRSGEMPNVKTAARFLAAQSGVRTRSIEKGEYWDMERESLRSAVDSAMETAKGKKLYLSDGPLSLPGVIADINFYYHRHNVKRFLFDRVGLFDEVVNSSNGDVKARDTVIASLRRVANVLGIGIVIYSQLTKEAEKTESKRPEGHMIFGGTGGPANCTKAALIYRPEAHKLSEFKAGPHKGTPASGLAEVYTVYNNSDELRSTLVRFIGDRQMFASNDGDLFAQDFVPDDAIDQKEDFMDSSFQDDTLPF